MPGFITLAWNFFKGNNLAALALAAGLLFAYHKVVVAVQENKIAVLTTDNATLKTNQKTIETANKSLSTALVQLQNQQEEISKSVKDFQDKSAELREFFELQRIRISNDSEAVRSFVKKNPKAFIIKANKEIDCALSQFGRNNCFFILGNEKGPTK